VCDPPALVAEFRRGRDIDERGLHGDADQLAAAQLALAPRVPPPQLAKKYRALALWMMSKSVPRNTAAIITTRYHFRKPAGSEPAAVANAFCVNIDPPPCPDDSRGGREAVPMNGLMVL
jgi:hypothetical protein